MDIFAQLNEELSKEKAYDKELTRGNRIVLAIIGSRTFNDVERFNEEIEKWIEEYGEPDEIVSGGATGADTLGEEYAKKIGVPVKVFKPDYKKYSGRYAPIARNTQIIEYCTHVLAFPSQNGSGTQDAIKKAKKLERRMRVIYID